MKNKENGITLIALIITIIVMLILVAVTINVALNGGIFDKAKNASETTNLAKEKEILQTTALEYLDNHGYVDLETFATAKNNLEGYTLQKPQDKEYVIATKGENTFYITKQGGITKTEPQNVTPQQPENPQTPTIRGYTLNSPSALGSLTNGIEFEGSFYINYETEQERGINVVLNEAFGAKAIVISDNDEYLYVYPVNTILDFDDMGITAIGGEWTKIIIGDTYVKDTNFSQSNYPVYDGYETCGEKNDEDNGKTLEDANSESGISIFVLAQ